METERSESAAFRRSAFAACVAAASAEAICSVAEKLGPSPETVRGWVRQHEIDHGVRGGLSSDERERLRALEREVKELRRANEILKAAAATPRRLTSTCMTCTGSVGTTSGASTGTASAR